MSQSIESRLRRRIADQRADSSRPRYPEDLKAEIVAFTRRRMAEGASRRRCALDLGLPVPTLALWMRGAEPEAGFRPVRQAQEEPDTATPSGELRLVTPAGHRVEGLDLEGLVAVLRALA